MSAAADAFAAAEERMKQPRSLLADVGVPRGHDGRVGVAPCRDLDAKPEHELLVQSSLAVRVPWKAMIQSAIYGFSEIGG
ncbi:MAG TPA: hypothetical protein VGQ76_24035 [Thermoanaerobaculia bacterium]|nr:hypothetical protein [Thermoanaerobaculia bacterium]